MRKLLNGLARHAFIITVCAMIAVAVFMIVYW
jgi:hypothetical protein